MDIDLMQLLTHTCLVRKTLRVQFLLAPSVSRPGLPVLNDAVQPHMSGTVLPRSLYKLLLRLITLLRLHIAICPLRKHRRLPGQIPVSTYKVVERIPGDKIVVQLTDGIQKQIGTSLIIVEGHQAPAVKQDRILLIRQNPRHGDAHVVLVQVLHMIPVSVDTLLPLSETVNLFPFVPLKMNLRPVRSVVVSWSEVVDEIPLAVNCLHPADNRLLPAGGPCLNHEGCQFLAAFP